jgi:hypothetical protein
MTFPSLKRVDPLSRASWMSVIVVGVLAAGLAATGGRAALADTTVLLVLTAFVLVIPAAA